MIGKEKIKILPKKYVLSAIDKTTDGLNPNKLAESPFKLKILSQLTRAILD